MRISSRPRVSLLHRAAISAAAGLFCCGPAFATNNWTGGSTVNSNWSSAANWQGGSVPISSNTTDVLFTNSPRPSPVDDLANPLTIRSLWFYDNVYSLSGNGLAFDGAFAAIDNYTTTSISNSITLNANISYEGTGNITFSNTIGGVGGFTKNGSGTVNLNFFTLFTGDTNINAGQIVLFHPQGLLSTTVNLNVNNGLNLNGQAAQIGNIGGAGSLSLGAANINVGNTNSSASYSGQITGTGSIDKRGTGAWTLSGVGSNFPRFSVSQGSTIVSGGSLSLTSTSTTNRALTLGNGATPGSMTVQAGAVLNTVATGLGNALIGGGSTTASTLTVAGVGSRWDAAKIDIGSNQTTRGAVVVDNSGVINVTAMNVGKTEGGSLVVQNSGAVNATHLTLSSTAADPVPIVALRSGGQTTAGETILSTPTSSIDIDRATLTTGMLTSAGGSGSITLRNPAGASALVISGSAAATYTGSIAGSGGITKNGASTQTLSGANTYSGATTVNGGSLIFASGASSAYNANGSGQITLNFGNLGNSSLRVSGGGTIHYPPTVIGGFVRGSDGTHDLTQVASFNGTTFGADSALTLTNPLELDNVTNSGSLTANGSLTWDGGVNSAAGRFIINGVATVSSFENDGVINVQRHGVLYNSNTNLVSGGGSQITIDAQGELRPLNSTTLDLRGSLLVNNGLAGGTTNVYFGALAAGVGEFGKVIVYPGGAYTPGVTLANMPPPAPTSVGVITPLDPDQSTATPIQLAANTTATVNTTDHALTLSGAMNGTGMTLTKAGGGMLALGSLRAGGLAVNSGTVRIVQNGTSSGTSTLSSISIANAAKLDLTNNKLVVAGAAGGSGWNGSAYGGVAGLVQSGYDGGLNDGSGIVTSQPSAVSPNVLTQLVTVSADDAGYAGGIFGGVPVARGDQLVMYTWGGDANLDGTLNGDDYFQIDSHFNQDGLVFGYFNGDYNYDGAINGDDYFIIDSNWNAGSTMSPFPTGAGIPGLSAVPEPGGLGLMGMAIVAWGRRRKRV